MIRNKDTHCQPLTRHAALVLSICVHVLIIFLMSLLSWGTRQTGSPALRTAQIVLVNAEDTGIKRNVEFFDAQLIDFQLFDSLELDFDSLDAAEPNSDSLSVESTSSLISDHSARSIDSNFPSDQYDANQALSGTNPKGELRSSPATEIDPQRLAEEQKWVASRSPQGEPTTLDFMGLQPLHGRSFVFLFDRSQSMQGEGVDLIQETRDHLLRSIGELQPEHRFQIAFYNDRVSTLSAPRLIQATDENKVRIESYLQQMVSVGGTNHVGGIFSALAFQPDVIILLSDGGDPPLTPQQLQTIRSANHKPSQIHCLQFGLSIDPPKSGNNFLLQLATENQGSYRYISTGKKSDPPINKITK